MTTFLRNCNIISKEKDGYLFKQFSDGRIGVFLDGYSIIPNEQYEAMYEAFEKQAMIECLNTIRLARQK